LKDDFQDNKLLLDFISLKVSTLGWRLTIIETGNTYFKFTIKFNTPTLIWYLWSLLTQT